VQGRNHRTGPRRGPIQSKLGEPIRGAAAGCSGSKTEIL